SWRCGFWTRHGCLMPRHLGSRIDDRVLAADFPSSGDAVRLRHLDGPPCRLSGVHRTKCPVKFAAAVRCGVTASAGLRLPHRHAGPPDLSWASTARRPATSSRGAYIDHPAAQSKVECIPTE